MIFGLRCCQIQRVRLGVVAAVVIVIWHVHSDTIPIIDINCDTKALAYYPNRYRYLSLGRVPNPVSAKYYPDVSPVSNLALFQSHR